jgi:hypothetical protein
MGTVTQYNLQNVQAALGGSNPISMNEYYRGGSFVPTTRSVTTREPSSGVYYSVSYQWNTSAGTPAFCLGFIWNGTTTNVNQNVSSFSTGGSTYFQGTLQVSGKSVDQYSIFRTTTSTVSINTGVPSSGTISISQLFGAENP